MSDHATDPGPRLTAVLTAYAQITHGHGDHELAPPLHRGPHVALAEQHLHDFVVRLIEDAEQAGAIRADVPAGELAGYCLNALQAASALRSKAAVDRLVAVTLGGLRPDGA